MRRPWTGSALAAVRLDRGLLPGMIERGDGAIVHVASMHHPHHLTHLPPTGGIAMPENQTSNPIALDELPEVLTRYLNAHRDHDTATALTTFTDGATVIDDGNSYSGTAAIRKWLNRTSTEYTYTTELTGAHRTDQTHYTAANRLEGNFPGGIVDLRYQFTLRDSLIGHLVIEP